MTTPEQAAEVLSTAALTLIALAILGWSWVAWTEHRITNWAGGDE